MHVSVQGAARQSVVVIPAAFRPEMLALSLESLAKVQPSKLDVRIYLDSTGRDNFADYTIVRDEYYPSALLVVQPQHIPAPSGCWNILNSIKAGYETGARYIFLLEEDVRVLPGYFEWAFEHLRQGRYAAVCPRRDRWYYPVHGPLYTNPGSVLPASTVAALVPHINDEYFSTLREYLDKHFGVWEEESNLDDGLIRRVCKQIGECKFPSIDEGSYALHQGFHYYNKIDVYLNREGDIHERIQRLREMLGQVRPTDRYAKDLEL